MLSKQENREILGKKIEELRKAKGMTQAELAVNWRSGIKRGYAKNTENAYPLGNGRNMG